MRRTLISQKDLKRGQAILARGGLGPQGWSVPTPFYCEICGEKGGEQHNVNAAEDIYKVRLCGNHFNEWRSADYSLEWLNERVPGRIWVLRPSQSECPECHKMRTIPLDDYICRWCRNAS